MEIPLHQTHQRTNGLVTNYKRTKKWIMKPKALFLSCGVLAGITALTILPSCSSSPEKGSSSSPGGASAGPEVSNMATQKAELLFVQTAKNVSFANGSMTLHGVDPMTICFTDRPERIAGHMPTTKIIPMWGEGKNSFTADPPNATLSMFSGDNVSNVVVTLRNPRLSGDDLTYEVRSLEGTPPAQGGACSLFIDIIGMPLTPYSYAGAARPGYVYGGVYGPAFVPAPYHGYPVYRNLNGPPVVY
jgi:hypothetical protein